MGLVDTGVIGQLGNAAAIGAVGVGAVILTSIFWAFGFLRMGTVGLVAQAIGAKDHAEIAAFLTRVLCIGFAAGFALIILQTPIFWIVMSFVPASPEIETLVLVYIGIRIFAAPAAIAVYGISGWLIAQERTGAVLILQLVQNGINIALSVMFVMGFEFGIAGVAWATLIAEWVGLCLGLWLCRAAFGNVDWRNWGRVFDRAILWRMAAVNTDILIRSLLLLIAFASFMFLGAGLGDETVAANQILIQFLYITSYAMDGFAFAAESLVGQSMGARHRTRLRRAAILTSLWGFATCVVLAGVFWMAGPDMIDIMTTASGVQDTARAYLPWMIMAPLIGAASWMLDGIFIGATRTRDMRNMMIVSFAVYAMACVILLPLYDNHGLWAALLIFFAMRGVTLFMRYPALERASAPG